MAHCFTQPVARYKFIPKCTLSRISTRRKVDIVDDLATTNTGQRPTTNIQFVPMQLLGVVGTVFLVIFLGTLPENVDISNPELLSEAERELTIKVFFFSRLLP